MGTQSLEISRPVSMPGPVPAPADAGDAISSYFAGQLSPRTRRAYRADFADFVEFLGLDPAADWRQIVRALCQVTRDEATRYRDKLIADGKAPATITRKLSVAANVYAVLVEERVLEKNPFGRVKRPRVSREGKTPALTKRQAEKLLATPDRSRHVGHRDFVLLGLLFFCGLRRHEVVKVRREDFVETSGHVVLRVRGKGGKDASVKVAPALWREVQAYILRWGLTGHLFPAMSRNEEFNNPDGHISTTAVAQLFKKYCRRAGLDAKRLAPHSARATAITLALDGGASVRQVQHFARHADANTTLRYDRARQNLDDNAADYIRLKLTE